MWMYVSVSVHVSAVHVEEKKGMECISVAQGGVGGGVFKT